MKLTQEQYDYIRNLTLQEIDDLDKDIKAGNLDSLWVKIARCVYVGLRKELKQEPELETLNGILQFVINETPQEKLNGS